MNRTTETLFLRLDPTLARTVRDQAKDRLRQPAEAANPPPGGRQRGAALQSRYDQAIQAFEAQGMLKRKSIREILAEMR